MNNPRLPIGAIAARGLLETIQGIRPLTPQARTAGPADLQEIKRRFELATDLYVSCVIEMKRAINENMPLNLQIDFSGFESYLAEARQEVVGQLVNAEDMV